MRGSAFPTAIPVDLAEVPADQFRYVPRSQRDEPEAGERAQLIYAITDLIDSWQYEEIRDSAGLATAIVRILRP